MDGELIYPDLKVAEVRPMTDAELDVEYWDAPRIGPRPVMIVFENGVRLFSSQDEEGNGPGALFALQGDSHYLIAGGRG